MSKKISHRTFIYYPFYKVSKDAMESSKKVFWASNFDLLEHLKLEGCKLPHLRVLIGDNCCLLFIEHSFILNP